MAKARNYFGLRTGSTKSKTFSILNGWQIEKDRVYGGKNPRTNAQMRQRMVMATASAAYSGMREIVDHSFEGVTYGQPTMSKFISENAKMLLSGLLSGKSYLSFNPYQDRKLYPNPYIISKGTLPNAGSSFELNISEGGAVSVLIDSLNITENETTLGNLLSQMGLNINSYITFVCCAYNTETGISQFGWCRFYPKKEQINAIVYNSEISDLFDLESNVPLDTNVLVSASGFGIVFDFDQEVDSISTSVITSKKDLTWRRSNAIMSFEFSNDTPMPAADALATYPVGTDYVLNGGSI